MNNGNMYVKIELVATSKPLYVSIPMKYFRYLNFSKGNKYKIT